jgi:hypothetical protein
MEKDEKVSLETLDLPDYERPTLTAMDRDDVLAAFQMTAAQISSAGCWWSPPPI